MDEERTWRKAWDPPPWSRTNDHGILAFSDGGYRSPNCASIGWMIYYVGVVNGKVTLKPMAAEAIYFAESVHDSFQAELIALDICLDHVYRYANRSCA